MHSVEHGTCLVEGANVSDTEELVAALSARLDAQGLKVVRQPAYSRESLERVEEVLGAELPTSYVDFVTRIGPFEIVDAKGYAWSFIPPERGLEHMEAFAEASLEEADLDDPDDEDSQAWIAEARLRRMLFPFVQADSSVHDVLCFYSVPIDGELSIIDVRQLRSRARTLGSP